MSDSIGAALRAARERRKLTLAQVSETTRIRPQFLQALENDDLSAMTSSAQARGFLRIYAELLDLDLEALIPPSQTASVAEPTTAAESPSTPSAPEAHQEAQAARPGILRRLRQRIAARIPSGAQSESKGASVPGTAAGTDEASRPEPQAKLEAAGKKKGRT